LLWGFSEAKPEFVSMKGFGVHTKREYKTAILKYRGTKADKSIHGNKLELMPMLYVSFSADKRPVCGRA